MKVTHTLTHVRPRNASLLQLPHYCCQTNEGRTDSVRGAGITGMLISRISERSAKPDQASSVVQMRRWRALKTSFDKELSQPGTLRSHLSPFQTMKRKSTDISTDYRKNIRTEETEMTGEQEMHSEEEKEGEEEEEDRVEPQPASITEPRARQDSTTAVPALPGPAGLSGLNNENYTKLQFMT